LIHGACLLLSRPPHAGKAVIIMDAQCMIQAANQVAHNVFGYGKNELRGRNINILIPP
jgi:PAS domain S-box-containing protein